MGDLGNHIIKKQPDFDPRSFGFHQLTPLVKSMNAFEIEERRIPDTNVKHVYIRNK
ncbi:OST-HTH/LOTUS domain-containing protein [Erysipelothrix sp. D19-032]